MRERLGSRKGDVSDATAATLDQQLTYDLGAQNFAVVDAGRPIEEVIASCLRIIGVVAPESATPGR
jgi:predicted kinase